MLDESAEVVSWFRVAGTKGAKCIDQAAPRNWQITVLAQGNREPLAKSKPILTHPSAARRVPPPIWTHPPARFVHGARPAALRGDLRRMFREGLPGDQSGAGLVSQTLVQPQRYYQA